MCTPLTQPPFTSLTALYLIKEELKSRRFFRALQEMGLDDCYFQPHLDTLILQCLGMDDDEDATFDAYYSIMEHRSKKINTNDESITSEAMEAYRELIDQKKRMAQAKKILVQ